MSRSMCAVLVTAVMSYSPMALAAWETRQLEGMSVEVYTPSTTSPIGSGHALMIGLHGCAQTGTQLRDYGNVEATAEDFGMIIALPTVAGGGVIAGCWNYYGAAHSRAAGDPSNIIGLAESLRDDGASGIDPAQIYLVGFSSGGGEALIAGCLAPDVFAGVAVSAGPSLGTTVSQIGSVGTTVEQAAALCEQFAGTHTSDLATQLAIAFTDTQDFTVAQGYAPLNADMYASIYGGGAPLATTPIDVASLPGSNPIGTGVAYEDGEGERVVLVTSTGVGHNWPAGSGTMGPALSYVSGTGLNLSYFAAEMFTANNRRAEGEWNPTDDSGGEGGSEDGGDDGDASGEGSTDDEEGSATAGDGDDASDDASDDEDSEDGQAPSSASAGFAGDHVEPSGCQCSSGDRPIGTLALLLLALPVIRRRALH